MLNEVCIMSIITDEKYHLGEKTSSTDEEMIETYQESVRHFGFSGRTLAYPNDEMHDEKVKHYVQNLVKRIQNGDRLLDIGCGYGSLFTALLGKISLELTWHYQGIDIMPDFIGEALRKFRGTNAERSFGKEDMNNHAPKTDWGVLLGVVNSVSEPQKLIDNAWKACDKGLFLDLNSIEKKGLTKYNTFDIPAYIQSFEREGARVITEDVWDGCTILMVEKNR